MNKINILVNNESSQSPFEIFAATKRFFGEFGYEINFYERNENHGYHAHLLIKDNNYVGGGARIQEKKDGWYQLTYYMGKLRYAPTLDSILTHEILHLFFQEFGLGDIHKCPGAEKLGQWYNKEAMEYWLRNAKLKDNKPDKSIVHHNAVKRCSLPRYTIDKNYHLSLGWCDLGYHFYIEADGELKIGRWLVKRGAHCIGQNTKSIGICLAGNFMVQKPTKAQTETLKKLLKELEYKEIGGHRIYQANRTCPGKLLSEDYLKSLMTNGIQTTREIIRLLYKAVLHCTDEEIDKDPEAMKYAGHWLGFVLIELMKSKKWKIDHEIIRAIYKIIKK